MAGSLTLHRFLTCDGAHGGIVNLHRTERWDMKCGEMLATALLMDRGVEMCRKTERGETVWTQGPVDVQIWVIGGVERRRGLSHHDHPAVLHQDQP